MSHHDDYSDFGPRRRPTAAGLVLLGSVLTCIGAAVLAWVFA
jgi:hypothetical protein